MPYRAAPVRLLDSCTFRLSLIFTALVSATTTVALIVVGLLLYKGIDRSMDLLHDGEFDELAELIHQRELATHRDVLAKVANDIQGDKGMFYIQVQTNDGQLLYRSPNLGDLILPSSHEITSHQSIVVPRLGSVRLSRYSTATETFLIASLRHSTEIMLGVYLAKSLWILLAALLLSAVLGWGFARLALAPLRQIHEATSQIRPNSLGVRIPVPATNDELAALVRLLNGTFDSLDKAFAQIKRFSADASHELKTPLALIRLNAERIQAKGADDPELTAAIDEILEECDSMKRSIELLLFLAKVDAGVLKPAMKDLRLPALLADFEEDATAIAEDVGRRFLLHPVPDLRLRGEPTLLRQVLLNLMSNALRHAPEGSLVELRVERRDETCVLTLSDEGPGVPEEQLGAIFERFVQVGSGETAVNTQHHGLGLEIVRSIVQLHEGRVEARNRTDRPSGLSVSVYLPLQPETAA